MSVWKRSCLNPKQVLQNDSLIHLIGCSRALVYFRGNDRILLVLLSVPEARCFFFFAWVDKQLKASVLHLSICHLHSLYVLHHLFWFLTDECLLYLWCWGEQKEERKILWEKEDYSFEDCFILTFPCQILTQKAKKKTRCFVVFFFWMCTKDTFSKCDCVFVHSLFVFPPGFRSWRWWRGWRSRARCTMARCKTAWCCWWTECKCCWCSRHSYSYPAPDRRFRRPTRRWIPVRHAPAAQKHAAVIRRTSWKKKKRH